MGKRPRERGDGALYGGAERQEEERDALGDAGDNLGARRFVVESALDRAKIYAAIGSIVDAYMSCFEAELQARRNGVDELIPKCQERQDEYYEMSDIDTRIACYQAQAHFLAKYIDKEEGGEKGGVEYAFDVLDEAMEELQGENRPDLKQEIIKTAVQILRREWWRLCRDAEGGKGAEAAPKLMRLSELAYYINQEDMGQLFEEDAERAERGELPLKANLDWPPEEDA